MEVYRPSSSKLSLGYKYSGSVSNSSVRSSSGSVDSSLGSGASYSVPKMTYKYSGLVSDIAELAEIAEISEAVPTLTLDVLTLEESMKISELRAEEARQNVKNALFNVAMFPFAAAATACNFVIGLVEGAVSLTESLADGVVVATGTVVSSLVYAGEVLVGDTDHKASSAVMDGTARIAAYDATEAMFDVVYSIPSMQAIDNLASRIGGERGGVIYGIAESTGYYSMAMAYSAASGIPAPALLGAAEFGKTSQKEFSRIYDENGGRDITVGEFYSTVGYSAAKGGVTYAFQVGAKYVEGFKFIPENIAKQLGIGVKSIRPFVNEGLSSLYTGEEYDTMAAFTDSIGVLISENLNLKLKKYLPSPRLPSNPTTTAGVVDYGNRAASMLANSKSNGSATANLSESFSYVINKGEEKAVKETITASYEWALGLFY